MGILKREYVDENYFKIEVNGYRCRGCNKVFKTIKETKEHLEEIKREMKRNRV